MKKILYITFLTVLLALIITTSTSAVADYKNSRMSANGFDDTSLLFDGNERTYATNIKSSSVVSTVQAYREDGVHSLYIVFDRIPEKWTLVDTENGNSVTLGENAFLHEFVDVEAHFGYAPKNVRMDFALGTVVSEIYAFGDGELPDWVQRWEVPLDKADLLMISSHSDDEQLFFAGVLPYYAGELGYDVQVIYVVSHFNTHERPHEQLDGLWKVGIKNYPIISDIPDLYSESYDAAIATYKTQGVEFSAFEEYITECIRRFRPLVIISHDIKGEYGHGAHLLVNHAIRIYLDNVDNEGYFPESADKYGLWTPQKTYFHLYDQNQITMNWDVPLEAFGGKTAFEMSQEGFKSHKSQHWTWFNRWIYGTTASPVNKATDIKDYSPCLYGLYQTTVGYDTIGGDFFENVKTYAVLEYEAESERLAEESRIESIKAENESREEASRIESESIAEAERESEIHEPEKSGQSNIDIGLMFILIVVSGIVLSIVIITTSQKTYNRKR